MIECELKIEYFIVCDTKQVNQSVGAEKDKNVNKSVPDTSAKSKSLVINNYFPLSDNVHTIECEF